MELHGLFILWCTYVPKFIRTVSYIVWGIFCTYMLLTGYDMILFKFFGGVTLLFIPMLIFRKKFVDHINKMSRGVNIIALPDRFGLDKDLSFDYGWNTKKIE